MAGGGRGHAPWRAWRRLGEQERQWWGLGVEDGYGRWGKREARWGLWGEGVVDMGRRSYAWRRPRERERWWSRLGVGVAYGGDEPLCGGMGQTSIAIMAIDTPRCLAYMVPLCRSSGACNSGEAVP